MCSKVTKENILCYLTQSWISSAQVLKIWSIQQNCHWRSHYYIYFNISEYLPHDKQITLVHANNITVLFYRTVFIYILSNQYISNIYNIYNLDEKLSLSSQTICDHIFQIRLRIILSIFFGYVTLLYFFSYVEIFHLLWRGGGVGIYYKLILNWI